MCLCLCVLSVSGVYLQCVVLGVPVVGGVSSCNVCLGLCLGFCTVSSAVAGGKLVCVGSVFSVSVCVGVCLCVCRFFPVDVL